MNKSLKIIVLSAILVLLSASIGVAQPEHTETDPILARLDSLNNLHFFQKRGEDKQVSRKLPFDSVPKFSAEELEILMAELDRKSPFNMVYNRSVDAYIRNYGERYRELTEKMLGLGEHYFPLFEEKLDAYNLPLELKYLAIVESALNPNARSQAGATGLWQFMYRTGKMYNLQVSSYIDDRKDPLKSTTAACEYLSHLYTIYGDWMLVLAAYNAGPGNVNKAIHRSGGRMDYWEIRSYLPSETRGYIPAFIGASFVMTYAKEFNIYPRHLKETFLNTDSVLVTEHLHFTKISKTLGVPIAEIRQLNPQYKLQEIPGTTRKPLSLFLPSGYSTAFASLENEIYGRMPELAAEQPIGMVTKEVKKIHTVSSGEFLGVIAKKYKCSVADIQRWNALSSTKINPGQHLTVYMVVSEPAMAARVEHVATADEKNVKPAPGTYIYYTVQSGDTLWDIASKYPGITVQTLRELNKDINAGGLQVGQVIKLHRTGT